MSRKTIILSGQHSGVNPSPGLGIARSLRGAGDFRLIGLDYSPNSSGLHSNLLDETVLMPSWSEVDLKTWDAQLCQLTSDPDSSFISSLDLEVRLIAERVYGLGNFLSPSSGALRWITKPPGAIAQRLGFESIPSFQNVQDSRELASFIRRSPHGVWVKGQHYEAFRAVDLFGVLRWGEYIEELWGGPWHVEEHVPGQEAGIAFVATEGRLIDCVQMRKTILTPAGKTWAGEMTDLDPDRTERLREWVAESAWHGGGEMELIERWNGATYLLEVNPRLPAWIHGATVALRNLPLGMVRGEVQPGNRRVGGFTRVVEELEVDPQIGLPSYPWSPDSSQAAAGKHPSGMPTVASRVLVRGKRETVTPVAARVPDVNPPSTTPGWYADGAVLSERLTAVRSSLSSIRTTFAYSVKTNPDPSLIRSAFDAGMHMEAISQGEVNLVRRLGVDDRRIILNGPGKWWPQPRSVRAHAIFFDSIAEMSVVEGLLDSGMSISADIVGLRLSRSAMASRFGVRVDGSTYSAAAKRLRRLTERLGSGWGIHFHTAASNAGPQGWLTDCLAVVKASSVLVQEIGTPPGTVDLGGGWHSDDLGLVSSAVEQLTSLGPSWLRETGLNWIFELGKSLLEPCGQLYSRVIVPPFESDDVVVDAGIGDLPEAPYWPHPVWVLRDGTPHAVPPGRGRILGRTCMESDILADRVDVSSLRLGDMLLFEMAGGYDRSMAYPFGAGHRSLEVSQP